MSKITFPSAGLALALLCVPAAAQNGGNSAPGQGGDSSQPPAPMGLPQPGGDATGGNGRIIQLPDGSFVIARPAVAAIDQSAQDQGGPSDEAGKTGRAHEFLEVACQRGPVPFSRAKLGHGREMRRRRADEGVRRGRDAAHGQGARRVAGLSEALGTRSGEPAMKQDRAAPRDGTWPFRAKVFVPLALFGQPLQRLRELDPGRLLLHAGLKRGAAL